MRQAVFITGFNNWGKTSIIQHLFDDRQRFFQGTSYRIQNVNADFTVETHSNDDYWGQSWANIVQGRINNGSSTNLNLFTALCPTMHSNNNFIELLSNAPFIQFDKLHIFLIEYKWEHHAKLIIDNIISEGSKVPNVNFVVINADHNQIDDESRWQNKIDQILKELKNIFP